MKTKNGPIMTDKELKRLYPEIWDKVFVNVKMDVEQKIKASQEVIYSIAHNAAFDACFEHHKSIIYNRKRYD